MANSQFKNAKGGSQMAPGKFQGTLETREFALRRQKNKKRRDMAKAARKKNRSK